MTAAGGRYMEGVFWPGAGQAPPCAAYEELLDMPPGWLHDVRRRVARRVRDLEG